MENNCLVQLKTSLTIKDVMALIGTNDGIVGTINGTVEKYNSSRNLHHTNRSSISFSSN